MQHICVNVTSSFGVGKSLSVRLEDDLADRFVQLGEHVRVWGYLQAGEKSSTTFIALNLENLSPISQRKRCQSPPRLPSLKTRSCIQDAASFLRDLSWSVLPGLQFCSRVKTALLLSLVSGPVPTTDQPSVKAPPRLGIPCGSSAPVFPSSILLRHGRFSLF
jgi:DNA replicative helicase MCM subunit Mcm2 (Cdc46/Mcm family)